MRNISIKSCLNFNYSHILGNSFFLYIMCSLTRIHRVFFNVCVELNSDPPPKKKNYVQVLTHRTCEHDLLWKRIFVDLIKDLEMKLSWYDCVVLNPML